MPGWLASSRRFTGHCSRRTWPWVRRNTANRLHRGSTAPRWATVALLSSLHLLCPLSRHCARARSLPSQSEKQRCSCKLPHLASPQAEFEFGAQAIHSGRLDTARRATRKARMDGTARIKQYRVVRCLEELSDAEEQRVEDGSDVSSVLVGKAPERERTEGREIATGRRIDDVSKYSRLTLAERRPRY